jgi:hypothetical protein
MILAEARSHLGILPASGPRGGTRGVLTIYSRGTHGVLEGYSRRARAKPRGTHWVLTRYSRGTRGVPERRLPDAGRSGGGDGGGGLQSTQHRQYPVDVLGSPLTADSHLRPFPLRADPSCGRSHLRPIPTCGRFPLTADSHLRPFPLTARSHLGRSHLRPIPTYEYAVAPRGHALGLRPPYRRSTNKETNKRTNQQPDGRP